MATGGVIALISTTVKYLALKMDKYGWGSLDMESKNSLIPINERMAQANYPENEAVEVASTIRNVLEDNPESFEATG